MCVCVCVSVCLCLCVFVSVYACMYVYACACMHACVLMLNIPIIFYSNTTQSIGCHFLSAMSLLDYTCVFVGVCVWVRVCVCVRVCVLMLSIPIIFYSNTIRSIGCHFLSTISLLDCTDDHHKGLGDSYCCLYFIISPY